MTVWPRKSGSLRRRLGVQLIGSAAILAAILAVMFQRFGQQIATESQDNVLLASTTSILENVSERDGQIVVDIPYAALSMLGTVSDDRVFYRIDAGETFLTGYEDLAPPNDGVHEISYLTTDYRDFQVRLVAASRLMSVNGQSVPVVVSLAQTQDGLQERLDILFRQAMVLGLGFFLIASVLSIWTVNRVFRPLQDLAGSVARRGPNDLRPFRADVPEEMGPLVDALNDFTGRLSRSLQRSEEFITEAAHRVRTPLATVRTQAEVIMRKMRMNNNRVALRQMIRAIDESSRTAGQLLDQAMVNLRTEALDRTEVDLASCVGDVVDRLRPVAELRDIALHTDLDQTTPVKVDGILVQNAITNILDNAIKYAPVESDITVETRLTEESAHVRVLDQGPGFGLEEPDRLRQRFVRGQAAEGTVGSGLGLTIAAQVFEAHGGGLTLADRSGEKGACVDVYLPR
ncbi:sensor histidine kinase [Thalassococcus sp. S3]|uniref:sensor histidine kinase n=1 Tax=Thalassococcus sp. S3 TaxID=2017482 RepID=UPI00102456F3|nr:sensor histidine kinase [Thalassococcus sp. S3]QBF33881.1 HAMP domain-containing histidine kinase [Thalassococcus sp. S3]